MVGTGAKAHEPPPLNDPPTLDVNVTVPVGVLTVPLAVSVTVAVHDVAAPTATEAGVQTTAVDVDLGLPRYPLPKLSPATH